MIFNRALNLVTFTQSFGSVILRLLRGGSGKWRSDCSKDGLRKSAEGRVAPRRKGLTFHAAKNSKAGLRPLDEAAAWCVLKQK
mgnify:CR=1 FL=1